MTTRLLRDLVRIPETVQKSDFVVSLSSGITSPERTLGDYVVTPQLATCFDQALSLVTSTINEGRSKGAYLHGSFGSGKSHFMAVLHLLLQGVPEARAKAELAPVISKYDTQLQGKNILLVPYHMVGKDSMEGGILGGYVDHIRELHPDASLPAVFASTKIFEDADKMRSTLGDDAFFSGLNGVAAGLEGFGSFGGGTWDAGSYDVAKNAAQDDTRRAQLTADLISAYFGAYADLAQGAGEGYVPFDEGLSAISTHAKGLGYDAVLLFLDELILWLASRMTDEDFVSREGAKVALLVEGSAPRPIPFVSLIARQRDLKDFLGEGIAGVERESFAHGLEWWSGRFDTITLEDRNLPAIVEKRLLKPLNESARSELDAAFETFVNRADRALSTLMTDEADKLAFRRSYPFSPALIEVLVGVSAFLQRERTSLKLLLQLLVDRRDVLSVGDVVPLGELWDVVESGEEPFDQVLKTHFQKARQLYTAKLRPMLLDEHGLTEDDVPGLADNHVFHGEDRLAKTLLLAALVPDVPSVKGLTVGRLTDLNHGSVRSPIPGGERKRVLATVKKWASRIGELQIGEGQDPSVALQLVGVDVNSIIESASSEDRPGTRIRLVRDLVGDALGIDTSAALLPSYTYLWRGRRRQVDLAFSNIRDPLELPDSEFRSTVEQPKVIIDYPFDVDGKGPRDDHARVQQLRTSLGAHPTLCWIPRNLTERARADLGRLVVLEYLLTGDRLEQHTGHLAAVQRSEARQVLDAQRRQLRTQVSDTLRMAYGVTSADPSLVDVDSIEQGDQFIVLDPAIDVRPPVQPTLQDAFHHLLDQLWSGIAPAHPRFPDEVKKAELARTLELVSAAAGRTDRRLEVEQSDRRLLAKVVAPLQLGTIGESHFVLDRHWRDHFHRLHAADPGPRTVERLRAWTDEPVPMRLDADVLHLVIAAYAVDADLVLHRDGVTVQPTLDNVTKQVELREVDLPDEGEWERAVERASSVFQLVVPPLRTASNVAELAQQIRTLARQHRDVVAQARTAVATLADRFEVPADAVRRTVGLAAEQLLEGVLAASRDVDLVTHLATAAVPTTPQALGVTIRQAARVADAVGAANLELLDIAHDRAADGDAEATVIRDRLRTDIGHDQHASDLAEALQRAIRDVTVLVGRTSSGSTPPPSQPASATVVPGDVTVADDDGGSYGLDRGESRTVSVDELSSLADELRSAGVQQVTVTWDIP